ncbi:serine/threonine protein kinase [Actinokineospora spheciospongiae]|uniref:non-specific serine/threonine protein kinase n=1 Tax=Actinokineospora spheciospongiae TaxID=909613 RepID=W7IW68_9PSEU|nr:serine/threonine-protein kinase [Actinokineospora spheciospongiae]EWC58254.1 serine/threonine protein kinase [Actinokineospora spheciospongiae]
MTSSADRADLLVAGRYRLLEPLGVGSTAEVYRALDTRLDRPVAVKVLTGTAEISDPRRFANEIRTLAGLSHPNLVAAYDAGTEGGTPFVVLSLVEGCTLRELVKRGPLSVAEVRRIGAVLADVLAHVHEHGIVHRDVKPSNILVDTAGEPHLTDFGLALLTGGTRLTHSDQMVGTAAFLAPEQVRGSEVGSAADVYALGLVLLECLTGRREYVGTEVEAAVARLYRSPEIPDDLPADLVRLLSLMTALTSRRRPTAAECAAVLRGPGEEPVPAIPVESAAPAETAVLPVPAPRRQVPRKYLVTAGVALLSAVGTTLVLTAGSTPPESVSSPPEPPGSSSTVVVVPPAVGVASNVITGRDEQPRQVADHPVEQVAPVAPGGAGKPADVAADNSGPGKNSSANSGGGPAEQAAKKPAKGKKEK